MIFVKDNISSFIFPNKKQTMQLLSLSSLTSLSPLTPQQETDNATIVFISFNFPKKIPITSKNKHKNERYHRRYGRGTLGLPP